MKGRFARCKNIGTKNLILIVLTVLIIALPLIIYKNADFAGSDDKAEKAITQINKDYKLWFKPLWEPPSGEVESLMFALQAALGAGFIGYYIGYVRGKRKGGNERK